MDWQQFQNDQQFSPGYDPHHPQMDYSSALPPYPPPQFPPQAFQDSGIMSGYSPTSPSGAPPPPAWAGFFANGAPNPAAMTNYQSIPFHQMMPQPPFANASQPVNAANNTFAPNAPQQGSRKGHQKSKKTAQNSRNPNSSSAKGQNKPQGQDSRPSKKTRTNNSNQNNQASFVGESLNQSMQRLGSSKAARNKQATQAQKTPKATNPRQINAENNVVTPIAMATDHSSASNFDQMHAHIASQPSVERERIKHFLRTIYDHDIRFGELVHEGFDSRFLQELYAEIGIDVSTEEGEQPPYEPVDVRSSTQDHGVDDEMYEPTDELNELYKVGVHTPAPVPSGQVHSSGENHVVTAPEAVESPGLPPSSNREDYLARLKALKAGHSIPAAHPSPLPGLNGLDQDPQTPLTGQFQNDNAGEHPTQALDANMIASSQEDLARARDKARRAFAASRAARKAQQSTSTSAAAASLPTDLPTSRSRNPDQASPEDEIMELTPTTEPQAEEKNIKDAPKAITDSAVSTSIQENGRLPGLFSNTLAMQQDDLDEQRPLTSTRENTEVARPEEFRGLPRPLKGAHSGPISPAVQATPREEMIGGRSSEDFIEFVEGDESSFSGYQRSAEPDLPGLTAISRHRPQSTASNRPSLPHSSSYKNQVNDHLSRIDNLKKEIEQAELKKKVKIRQANTPGTPLPQLSSILNAQPEDVHSDPGLATGLSLVTTEIPMGETIADDNTAEASTPLKVLEDTSLLQSQTPTDPKHDERLALSEQINQSNHSTDKQEGQAGSDMSRLAALEAEMLAIKEKMRREQETAGKSVQAPQISSAVDAKAPNDNNQATSDQPVMSPNHSPPLRPSADEQATGAASSIIGENKRLAIRSPPEEAGSRVQMQAEVEAFDTALTHGPRSLESNAGSTKGSPTSFLLQEDDSASKDDSHQDSMDIDSHSEGEIGNSSDSANELFEEQHLSNEHPSDVHVHEVGDAQVAINPDALASVLEETENMSRNDSSIGDSSIAMDLEASIVSDDDELDEGNVSQSHVEAAGEAEYSPEPVLPDDPSYQSVEQRVVSILSSSSSHVSEDYEPPQPDSAQHDPVHGSAGSEDESSEVPGTADDEDDYEPPEEDFEPAEEEFEPAEEDYEPPELGDGAFARRQQPQQPLDNALATNPDDPDDLFEEANSDEKEDTDAEPDSVSDIDEPYSPGIP